MSRRIISDTDIAGEIPIETGKSRLGECRPEGPPVNRPDRQVRIQYQKISASKTRHKIEHICAAPSALIPLVTLSRPDGRAYSLLALRA
jgi:hypothetical protein